MQELLLSIDIYPRTTYSRQDCTKLKKKNKKKTVYQVILVFCNELQYEKITGILTR